MNDPRDQFYRFMHSTSGRYRRVVSWPMGQPGWVARIAAMASLLVLVAIVLILVIPALLIGAIVFLLLSVYVAIRVRIAAWASGREKTEGRKNVRVIRRD